MGHPVKLYNDVAKLYERHEQAISTDRQDKQDDIKTEISRKMNEAGYREAPASGNYRAVHLNDGHAVKFARGVPGKKENASEVRNGVRISNADTDVQDVRGDGQCSGEKYIADIKNHDTGRFRWLVMDKVKVTPNNVSADTANAIQTAFAGAGIHIAEIEPANMGRIRGVPVVFDYGGT